MTAASHVMERARTYFTANARDQMTTLTANLALAATTATVASGTGITEGTLIDIDAETIYVGAATGGSLTGLIRGQRASEDTPHGSGAVVRVNPKVHNTDLFLSINDELAELSSPSIGLFRPEIVEISGTSSISIPLTPTGELIEVRAVRHHPTSERWMPVVGWEVIMHPVSATYPAGWELRLNYRLTGTIEVVCATDFIPLDDTADDVEGTSGLPETALDLLTIGTALRVGLGREQARNFTDSQGDTRRAQEVSAGANSAAPAGLRALRQRRILAESSRLETRYPRQSRYG